MDTGSSGRVPRSSVSSHEKGWWKDPTGSVARRGTIASSLQTPEAVCVVMKGAGYLWGSFTHGSSSHRDSTHPSQLSFSKWKEDKHFHNPQNPILRATCDAKLKLPNLPYSILCWHMFTNMCLCSSRVLSSVDPIHLSKPREPPDGGRTTSLHHPKQKSRKQGHGPIQITGRFLPAGAVEDMEEHPSTWRLPMTENTVHLLPSLTAADNREACYTPPDDEELNAQSESSTCVLGQSGYCQV